MAYGSEERRRKGEVFLNARAALAAKNSAPNLGSSIVMGLSSTNSLSLRMHSCDRTWLRRYAASSEPVVDFHQTMKFRDQFHALLPTTRENMAPATKRRKLNQLEEITFDPAARQEYLTGFHKRKQERIQNARDAAVKRAREDKIKERRRVQHYAAEQSG